MKIKLIQLKFLEIESSKTDLDNILDKLFKITLSSDWTKYLFCICITNYIKRLYVVNNLPKKGKFLLHNQFFFRPRTSPMNVLTIFFCLCFFFWWTSHRSTCTRREHTFVRSRGKKITKHCRIMYLWCETF